jgi:energy-coupling factor transporter transmembrane protein EcfT
MVNSGMLLVLEVILLLLITLLFITTYTSQWQTVDGVIGLLYIWAQINHASGAVTRGVSK